MPEFTALARETTPVAVTSRRSGVLVKPLNQPRIEAVQNARMGVPSGTPTAALDALIACSPGWSTTRRVQECIEVVAEISGAAQVALYRTDGPTMRCLGLAPPHLESPLLRDVPSASFPWGISSLQPQCFVLVEDASDLEISDSIRARDVGVTSAVHLPLRERGHSIGALHLFWTRPVTEWDDRVGVLLRALGVFAIAGSDIRVTG